MLAAKRVKYIFAEYAGNAGVLELLESYGYVCFDTAALIQTESKFLPRQKSSPLLRPVAGKQITLTTGKKWREFYFKTRRSKEAEWLADLRSVSFVQTDLLCTSQILDVD